MIFALHLTYISENLLFPFWLGEGHWDSLQRQLIPIFLWLFFLFFPLEPVTPFAEMFQATTNNLYQVAYKMQIIFKPWNKWSSVIGRVCYSLCQALCEALCMDNSIYRLEILSNAALILKQLYVNEKHEIGGKSKLWSSFLILQMITPKRFFCNHKIGYMRYRGKQNMTYNLGKKIGKK